MALRTPPALIGQIVVSSANNTISWFESGPHNLTTTVADGTYWPSALASLIAANMTAESALSGATRTYSGTFSEVTGKITLTGSGDWYPKTTTAESSNILTGGKTDSDGDTLASAQAGLNHLGFLLTSGYKSAGTVFTSDQEIAHVWIPEFPPETDSEERYEQTVVEAFGMTGEGDAYIFQDWEIERDEWPTYGHLGQRRTLTFAFVSQASSTQFLAWFWGPWAGAGRSFRYYPDRTDIATYYLYKLTGESLANMSRGERQTGYAWWTRGLEMRRVAT